MEFKMPDIGEGVMEGEVVKWLVKEGETVADDQPLVEVMTDKATVVIPCPTSGSVQKIRVGEGQTARVGEVLVTFASSNAGGAPAAAPAAEPARPARAQEEKAQAASSPQPARRETAEAPRAEAPRPQPVGAGVVRDNGRRATQAQAPAQETAEQGRVLAAPATRKLARENRVDLSRVRGSGPHGRVTREDLIRFLDEGGEQPAAEEQRQAPTAVAAPPQEWPGETEPAPPAAPPKAPVVSFPEGPRPETRVPMKGLRKRISEKMRLSKDHAAHFTYVEECDMTELVALRDSAEELAKEKGTRLTYLPFIVKAIVAGLKEFPYLNSSYDEERQEIVLKGYYNIGIAASNDEGLVVPVVKDCDRRSILEIAAEIQRLGDAARANRLKLEDLQGSTFTITSLGALGGILATPVIYYPEVAILGVHKIRKRPVFRGDEIVGREICYLSISIDHRVVDGHIGAQFMQKVVRLLEDPRLLMLGT
jgi:pyruvate dehydrogenase E2 component (dihydrolipoamide acetyltransferase)